MGNSIHEFKFLKKTSGDNKEKKNSFDQKHEKVINELKNLDSEKEKFHFSKILDNKKRIQSILTSMGDLLFVLDKNGIFIEYFKPLSKEVDLYLPPEVFIGKFYEDILPADVSKSLENAIEKIKNSGEKQQFDYSLELEGQTRIFSAKLSLLEDNNLKDEEFIAVVRDITEQKHIEKRFKMIAEVTTDLIYEWNVDNDSLEWFGDIDKKLGYSPREIPRTIEGWLDLVHPEDFEKLKDSIEFHRNNSGSIHETYRVKGKDNTWIYWEDKGRSIKDSKGKPKVWIGGCTNITNKIRSETELKNKIIELETFQTFAEDRELKMVNLKKEINELCKKIGEKNRYEID